MTVLAFVLTTTIRAVWSYRTDALHPYAQYSSYSSENMRALKKRAIYLIDKYCFNSLSSMSCKGRRFSSVYIRVGHVEVDYGYFCSSNCHVQLSNSH